MELQELVNAVRAWGEAKGISGPNGKGTLLGQLAKTQEELTETRDAVVKLGWTSDSSRYDEAYAEIMDGLGDVFVTIILAAEMAGLKIEDCLAAAYDEIKGRTGTMQGGIFIKDA
jgi:NTP pyrophosphatase (non-canonical NTP hydrolase)